MGLRAAEKREAFLAFLENGLTMLHLDARSPGVDVPVRLRSELHLRLNFSYKFNLSTFIIGEDAVEASLSFDGSPYRCRIPWAAVFGISRQQSGDARIWPEDMPPELLHQAAAMVRPDPEEDEEVLPVGGAARRVGHLRVIK